MAPLAPKLSVIAPAFDEQACIRPFVIEVCETLDAAGESYELVCVDDGSSDATAAILGSLRAEFPALRVLVLDRHQGQSAALAAGIAASRGEIVALIDCDLQNDPADISTMMALIDDNGAYDCVVGVRARRHDGWLRRIISRVANGLAARITRHRFRDGACGLKVCRGALLRRIPFFRGAHRFVPTLVALEGARVVEMEVNHRARAAGRSKYGNGLAWALGALRDALGVRWLADRRVRAAVREVSS